LQLWRLRSRGHAGLPASTALLGAHVTEGNLTARDRGEGAMICYTRRRKTPIKRPETNVKKRNEKNTVFQKELYNFESSYKFIQRTCTVFRIVII
jgi:hypothetical protein